MELADYLEAENVKDMTFEEIKQILQGKLNREDFAKLNGLWESLYTEDADIVLVDLYAFYSRHNLNHLMHSQQYQNICKEAPLVLENLPQDATVLDAGCKDGLKPVYYKLARPDLDIMAIDRNPLSLEYARQRAARYNVDVNFEAKNFFEYEPEQPFKAIVATKVFHEQLWTEHPMMGPRVLWRECFAKSYEMLENKGRLLYSISPFEEDFPETLAKITEDMGFRQLAREKWKTVENAIEIFVALEKV